jgi:lysyl-tRNA synthetase class 2
MNWRPGAGPAALRARAELLAATRAFFAARGVLEVETPMLAAATVTEPAIESLVVDIAGGTRYLQTSPEYAMKRLLAAGSGDIYQVARVFRAGEAGSRHNPEFTLLEWYRVGFPLARLIDETLSYVAHVLTDGMPVRRTTWSALLEAHLGVDALGAGEAALRAALAARGFTPADLDGIDRRGLRDLAYDDALRHAGGGVLVVDAFPEEAAALARVVPDARGRRVAERFEVVIDGIEVANGYHELADADEQARRFALDRDRRGLAGQVQPAADLALLAALEHGLPDCSGVAIGLDRLLMRKLGVAHIGEVLAFDFARA